MSHTSISKSISLHPLLASQAALRAESLGVSLSAYVRGLVQADIQTIPRPLQKPHAEITLRNRLYRYQSR